MLAALVGNVLFINGVAAWIAITCVFSVGFVVGGGGRVVGVVGDGGRVVGRVVGGVIGIGVVIGGSVVGVVNGVVIGGCVVVSVVGGASVVGFGLVTFSEFSVVAVPSSSLNASSFVLIVLSGGRTM